MKLHPVPRSLWFWLCVALLGACVGAALEGHGSMHTMVLAMVATYGVATWCPWRSQ